MTNHTDVVRLAPEWEQDPRSPLIVVGRQPLMRASIQQLAEGCGCAAPVLEYDDLADLSARLPAGTPPYALILFREIGERGFYLALERCLRPLAVTPRVVLFSETLGAADWDALDTGRVSLLLPTKIGQMAAQRLLRPALVGGAATDWPDRGRLHQIVAEQRSLFMPDIQDLSAAELQVVTQLQRGLSNREIARSLGVQLCQIKKTLHEVSTKLAVSGRVNIATLTRRQIQRQARAHATRRGAGLNSGG